MTFTYKLYSCISTPTIAIISKPITDPLFDHHLSGALSGIIPIKKTSGVAEVLQRLFFYTQHFFILTTEPQPALFYQVQLLLIVIIPCLTQNAGEIRVTLSPSCR
jgi:hypothetical protein